MEHIKAVERPEWTDKYPAVDGIAKPDRNFSTREGVGGTSVVYDKTESAIRVDIQLMIQDENYFDTYVTTRTVVQAELNKYKLIAKIPRLDTCLHKFTIGGYSVISSYITSLEAALDYLDKIYTVYCDFKQKPSGYDDHL